MSNYSEQFLKQNLLAVMGILRDLQRIIYSLEREAREKASKVR